MQERLIELHQQRGRLLERLATQRNTLAQQLAPVEGLFDLPDRVNRMLLEGKALVVRHPLVVVALVASVVLLKPGAVLRWSGRGVAVWRAWSMVRKLLPNFLLNRLLNRA